MENLITTINSIGRSFINFSLPMLVQSTVLIIFILALDLIIRKRVRAVFRYCVWMLVLIKLVLPTTLSSPVSLGCLFGDKLSHNVPQTEPPVAMPPRSEPATRTTPAQIVPPLLTSPEITPQPQSVPISPDFAVAPYSVAVSLSWQGLAFLIWLSAVAAMALLLIQRMFFVRGLLARAKAPGDTIMDIFQQCRDQMRLRRPVSLKLSPLAASPSVCGLLRPTILIPQNLPAELNRQDYTSILLHELTHIKRGDLWVSLIQTVLQIAYFYNPLLWLANAIIRNVREQAVDEMVLVAMAAHADAYPRSLLNISKLTFTRPAFSLRLIGVVESRKALINRIKHIVSRPFPKTAKLGISGLLAILITALILLPMATDASNTPEFIIKGTVTDVETGQPLAGVKVGDNKEYSDTFYTFTDSNGHYEYKTSYEEHFTECRAAGYNAEKKIILTKLFGSEKEKVINFQLTPQQPLTDETQKTDRDKQIEAIVQAGLMGPDPGHFMAFLHDGVAVELVSVCGHPAEGKKCWRPDGSVLDTSPYKTTQSQLPEHHGYTYYEFAAEIRSSSDTSIKWDVPGGTQSSYTGSPFGFDGQRVESLKVYTANQPDEKESALVRIGVSSAPWQTLVSHNPEDDEETYTLDDGAVAFGRPYEKDGITLLPFVHNLQAKRAEQAFRVVAVTRSGKEFAGGGWGSGGNILHSSTFRFHLPLKDIAEFRFQTRPYQWVTFKDVSLKPGQKTDVKIEYDEPTAPSAEQAPPATDAPPYSMFIGLGPSAAKVQQPLYKAAEDENYRLTLPDGAEVKMIAVSELLPGRTVTWRPDGTKPPFTIYLRPRDDYSRAKDNYAFTLSVSGPEVSQAQVQWLQISDFADSQAPMSVLHIPGHEFAEHELLFAAKKHLPNKDTTSIKLRVACDNWQTRKSYDGRYSSGDDDKVTFIEAYQTGGGVNLVFSHDYENTDIKVTADYREDRTRQTASGWLTKVEDKAGNELTAATFSRLKLEDISEFELYTRPFYYVQFENVSLRPSFKIEKPPSKAYDLTDPADYMRKNFDEQQQRSTRRVIYYEILDSFVLDGNDASVACVCASSISQDRQNTNNFTTDARAYFLYRKGTPQWQESSTQMDSITRIHRPNSLIA